MNATQQEQLLNIGTYLRDVRKEKGKDIDEVANQIFIRPALVRAIEAGDWESLPEPVFVQGFIRRYADYLGLDGRDLAKKFEPTPVSVLPNPELANRSGVEGVIDPQDKHGLKVLSKVEPATNGTSALKPTSAPSRNWNWLFGLVGLAAVVGVIVWLTSRNTPQQVTFSNPADEEVVADNAALEDTPSEVAAEAPTPEVAEAPETPEAVTDAASTTAASTSDAPLTFAVNIESDAWMRVTADGQKVYEGILTAGTEQSWTADNELRITAGNSGAVLYSFNGSEEKPMGAPGSVSNLTLTPQADSQSPAQ